MTDKYTGFCVRCREKDREMKNVKIVVMKGRGGKRKAAKGNCTVCDCGMYKILGKA